MTCSVMRRLLKPALWLRDRPAAAAENNASAGTDTAAEESFGGKEPTTIGIDRGAVAPICAAVEAGGVTRPSPMLRGFSSNISASDHQDIDAAHLGARAQTRLEGNKHGGGLHVCGIAAAQSCNTDDRAEHADERRSSYGNRGIHCSSTSITRETGKLPPDHFDPAAAATAATLVPGAGDDLSDEDVKDSECSRDTGRCSIIALEAENTVPSKKGKTGFFATGIIIVKSFVGGGFLFLPNAMIKAGVVASVLTMTGIFALAAYCMTLLVQCSEASEARGAAEDAGQDGEGGSSTEGTRSGLCSTTTGNGSEDSDDSSNSGKKKDEGRPTGSFRSLLLAPTRIFRYSHKDSSSSSTSDCTGTGDFARRLTGEGDEGKGQTVQRCSLCPADPGGDADAATAQHQQVELGVMPLPQPTTTAKLTAGNLIGRGDKTVGFVVPEKLEQLEDNLSGEYECEVVVTSLPGRMSVPATKERSVAVATTGRTAEDRVLAAVEMRETASEMVKAASSVKESSSKAVLSSYEGVARLACGLWGERVIEACVVVSQFSFATVNIVLVAGNVRDIVWTAADCAPEYNWSLQAIIWTVGLVYVPLCLIRRMKHLVPVALLANVGTAVGVVLLMVAIMLQLADRQQQPQFAPVPLVRWNHWPLILGTSIYLWEGAGLVLPIRQEAKPKVQKYYSSFFTGSLALLLVFYLVYSLICCLAFGDELQILILFNLRSGALSLTVQAICAVAIIATYPLMMYPACGIIERHLGAWSWLKQDASSSRRKKTILVYGFRALVALMTVAVATVGMRQLDDFVALIGGLCGAPLVFVFPVYFHMRLVEEGRYRRLLHCCVVAAGVAIQAFSVYWSIANWKGNSEFAARCLHRPVS